LTKLEAVTSSRRRDYLDLVPVALVVVAEAAWVSVIGGFIQELRLQAPVLGIPILAVFVTLGIVAARTLGLRLGRAWTVVGLLLSVSAGLVGWLIAPEARAALGAGDPATAIAQNPGGWVAGLAVLRGYANARFPITAATVNHMLQLGIPGLALLAVVGGAIVEPWRGIFLADTLVAAVVFVGCGTLAATVARQRAVDADHRDWRRNRSWLGLLVGAVGVAMVVATASSGVLGPLIPVVLGILLVPFLVLALAFGTERRTFRIVGIFSAVAIVVYIVLTSVDRTPEPPPETGGSGLPPPTTPETDPAVILGLGGLGLVLTLIAVAILIRLWMGRVSAIEADLDEIRTIDHGDGPPTARHARRRRRGPTPTDAIGAYVTLMDDLERHPTVRRDPAETPAEHARRLRDEGLGDFSLDLLAADYALVRFGGVGLSTGEDRRAVARWRRLRSRLGRA
jgi:hypothetical protein